MVESLQDLVGTQKLREAWPKIESNELALKAAIETEEAARIANDNAHLTSMTAHNATAIVFTPGETSIIATSVDGAIKEQDMRIDNLIINGDSGPEAADARVSAAKSKTFTVLKDRLEESEEDFIALQAETVTGLANVVTGFHADPTGVIDATSAFIAAVAACATTEYTESVPTQGARAQLFMPPGRFKISAKIQVPSYVDIIGSGRNATIIDSYITNGDPVFLIKNGSAVQQFYNKIEGFTINGRAQACQGMQINKTSRWIMRDVMIDRTLGEGLSVYESYLGDMYSCLIRACGDATHYSFVLSGPNANGGSHSVTMIGGEINGGSSSVNGVYLKYGTNVRFIGTTIEGFANGIGITNENGHSLVVDSVYFEGNKEDSVEVAATLSTRYVGNYFGTPAVGGRGHIGIFYAQGCIIEGNRFTDSASVKMFDSTVTGLMGRFEVDSSFRGNYAPNYPINISASLLTSASTTGSTIEAYDGSGYVSIRGQRSFVDKVLFLGDLQPRGGISTLNNVNVVVKAGTGSPEGVIIATRGIYVDVAGGVGKSIYIKSSGTNSAFGWLPVQDVRNSSTAGRPTVTTAGYMEYDFTLGKPIWWNGANWIDATGAIV